MAETVSKTASVSTAYGMDLRELGYSGPYPLKFEYSYSELQEKEEIPEDEKPTEDEIREFVNQKRAASARSTAQSKALTANNIQKPSAENDNVAIAQLKKTFMQRKNADGTPKFTEEQAIALAKQSLGID